MRRIPIAHVVFANPGGDIDALPLEAARAVRDTRGLDLELLVLTSDRSTNANGGEGTRVPFPALPVGAIEAAAASLAAALIHRPRARRPHVIQGSFLDGGGYAACVAARILGVPAIAVAHSKAEVQRSRRVLRTLREAKHVLATDDSIAEKLAFLGRKAEVVKWGTPEGSARLEALTFELV